MVILELLVFVVHLCVKVSVNVRLDNNLLILFIQKNTKHIGNILLYTDQRNFMQIFLGFLKFEKLDLALSDQLLVRHISRQVKSIHLLMKHPIFKRYVIDNSLLIH